MSNTQEAKKTTKKPVAAKPVAKVTKAEAVAAKPVAKVTKAEAVAAKPVAKVTKAEAVAAKVDAKRVNKINKVVQATTAAEAPITPLTKLLLKAGYVFAKTAKLDDERSIAHGYTHPDGGAAMFIHDVISTEVGARWILKQQDGAERSGKTAKELVLALMQPAAVSPRVVGAVMLLHKLTKGQCRLADLAGDTNYKLRVQLLKKLLGVDSVLVKQSGLTNLVKVFHDALQIAPASAAAMASAFTARCLELYRLEKKTEAALERVEQAEVKKVLQRTAAQRVVHDNKPILPGVKKLSAAKQQEVDAKAKADLAAQIAQKRRQEEYTPIAVPRPDSKLSIDLDAIHLLEDPNNGIVLMCLEKPNSQGAICVYNNGSRVAAGVVPTEVLNSLRPLVSEDLIRDVNQLLHPITAGVIVTPQAAQQLTAVLDYCKENLVMATETTVKTKKFAAPAVSAKKTAAKSETAAAKSEKPAKATKTAAKPETASVARVKFAEDTKIKVLHKGDNPYRAGTKANSSFDLLVKAKTFGEYAKLTEKSKNEVYDAAYFIKWASQPHGKAPAYIAVG